jgi:hypothetical protein
LVTERLALPEEYLQWLSMIGGAGMIAGGRLMMAAQFFGYLVYPLIQASISILVFKHTEETFVGRVNGLRNSLLTGAMIMGISLAGWLKGFLSIVVLYQLIAALFLLGMMITWPLLSSPDQKVVHKRGCRTVPKEKD